MVNKKILLTGASGWFGRSYISSYIKKFGSDKLKNLYLVTSDGRHIDHPDVDHPIQTRTFDQALKLDDIDCVVQAAFITRDYIQRLGEQEYRLLNLQILNKTRRIIEKNNVRNIFVISSGAAIHDMTVYGELKLLEEKEAISNVTSDVKIFRVYGATGSFISFVEWSALCDFIKCGFNDRPIVIKATAPVIRGYIDFVDLSDLINLYIQSGRRDLQVTFDACSDVTAIEDLARLVAKKLSVPLEVNSKLVNSTPANIYTGDPKAIIELAHSLGLLFKSLDEQVSASIDSYYKISFYD